MFDPMHRFVMEDYLHKPTFSSFLPGIAGPTGVPLWCYYNNRGQAVCSFGAQDRDHAIMEFSSAHDAYQNVSRSGFRTFAKVNGHYRELFTGRCDMHIGMSEVEITEDGESLSASALYFGVPGERTAALARIFSITNTGDAPLDLELLDGMSAIVPYGIGHDFLKNMSNLAKAWMQAEDIDCGRAYFRARASLEDSACVREVQGGNFCLSWDDTGKLLSPLVQPSLVFGEDSSLARAEHFETTPLSTLLNTPQVTNNLFPCCFLPRTATLQPGETVSIRSIYGQAEDKGRVAALSQRVDPATWFDAKRQDTRRLVNSLCEAAAVTTANPVFDAYARQTYLDNLLRGGTPTFFRHGEKTTPFYLYSRKHGDPEREYNYFSLGSEYFAQGNGNYRDVNQNRRCDVFFSPELGAENIHTFFDLIQTDGYNPLVLTPSTFSLTTEEQVRLTTDHPWAAELLSHPFTPGKLAMAAEDHGLSAEDISAFTAAVVCAADNEPNADFGEGYWCDHWTYNLDLIESYLAVFPEKKTQLLFDEPRYRWYDTKVLVNPRRKRYELTENGLRQYHALDETAKKSHQKWMHTADGREGRSTLIEKLLLLCAIKTATLDAAGCGIEMEGGKPGWYDALNGLPGLLGSSMAESCELCRLIAFTADALEDRNGNLSLYDEIYDLLSSVTTILTDTEDPYLRWDRMNEYKEAYRAEALCGYRGTRREISCAALAAMLRTMEHTVWGGIRRATAQNGGLIPTYFTFTADMVTEADDGPMPAVLTAHTLPLFLEGPVRYLKLPLSFEEKEAVAGRVKSSGLYDKVLGMYKVNESLASVSYEAGRAKAFTPGWLENESVWLHMEYKYLLELLKSGLYDRFSEEFHRAAVPFLAPARYGRSPLENVSFIASSANPDPSIHGRGFVARLSGSTAEFLQILQLMFFGPEPFRLRDDRLELALSPFIPAYLMPENSLVYATFLGRIKVIYHAEGLPALIPGKTSPYEYRITYQDDWEQTVVAPHLLHEDAVAARAGKIARIDVYMKEQS